METARPDYELALSVAEPICFIYDSSPQDSSAVDELRTELSEEWIGQGGD